MEPSRPEELTARGLANDIAASTVFLLGTALVRYLEHRLDIEQGLPGVLLLLFELTLICFGFGYLLRALNYLWEQFSFLVENVAQSPTWPRIVAASKWLAGVVRSAAVLALVIAVTFLVVVFIWSVLLGTMHHMGKEVAPLLEKLDRLFGVQRFASGVEPHLPSPLESHIVFAYVLATLSLGWLVRGLSYLVQPRVQAVPSGV